MTIFRVLVTTWLHLYQPLTMIRAFYLKATDKTFSLQSPTFETVHKLLSEIDEKKAVGFGLDPINC